jgi:hypothetical protein
MDLPSTPPMPEHVPGEEILTKHKEAIRQLYKQAKFMPSHLAILYNINESSINRILRYDEPERIRPNRTGRPRLLNDKQVNWIIEYLSETYRQRVLNWIKLHDELELTCSVKTLVQRLKQRGYFRCVACQKPYLTSDQVHHRFLWAIAHIFWHLEWRKILWSDEVTFLIGGRTAKERVTRKRGERYCSTCIQHQFHRGQTTPVHAWGAIGYGYKSPLLFIQGSGKSGAFVQKDYLVQILEPYIEGFLEDFALITHTLSPVAEPLFMEDGNPAHGHKSTTNCCARWRTVHGVILMPHPSTSPDMNPIEKCWRWIKQRLHRRQHQPTNEAEMQAAVREEWDAIPQEWINGLIDKQEHWVQVLMERFGWATPN